VVYVRLINKLFRLLAKLPPHLSIFVCTVKYIPLLGSVTLVRENPMNHVAFNTEGWIYDCASELIIVLM